jgi:molybdate transport system permease protein
VHLADWSPVFLSLKVAVLAVLLVAVIGVPLARLMARVEFHGKDIVEAALTLPLVLPPSVFRCCFCLHPQGGCPGIALRFNTR